MNIDPAELNQRIEFKRATQAPDGSGGHTSTLTTFAKVWAKVAPVRGQEVVQADRLQRVAAYVFTIRKNERLAISETDRILWKGREYNIRYLPDLVSQEQFIDIEAEAGVAQ